MLAKIPDHFPAQKRRPGSVSSCNSRAGVLMVGLGISGRLPLGPSIQQTPVSFTGHAHHEAPGPPGCSGGRSEAPAASLASVCCCAGVWVRKLPTPSTGECAPAGWPATREDQVPAAALPSPLQWIVGRCSAPMHLGVAQGMGQGRGLCLQACRPVAVMRVRWPLQGRPYPREQTFCVWEQPWTEDKGTLLPGQRALASGP